MTETKEVTKIVWPIGQSIGYKGCNHTGEVPILIGGIEIRLGGSPRITQEAIKASNLLISLNGQLPDMNFGQVVQFQYATLPDRGGVPPNWKEFVESTIQNMRSGFKILFWCHGSHGRTGTLGASLIALMEPEIEDPIAEIRARHCIHAVESLEQAKAIFALKGLTLPDKYDGEFKKPTSFGGYMGGGHGYGPKPLANGKDKEGRYYHHINCKCPLCLDIKTKFRTSQDIPCDCKSVDCLWDGRIRPAEGPYAHCATCSCGLCTNSRYCLVTYCQCANPSCAYKEGGKIDITVRSGELPPQTTIPQAEVISIEDGPHDWNCMCKPCITAECSGNVCLNNLNCNCYECVMADRKFELARVNALNKEYGRTNHQDSCNCAQCIQDDMDLEKKIEEDDIDTYRFCMQQNDDDSDCLGDTDNPCRHIMEEDEALELAAALGEVHGDYCQCQNCWAATSSFSIH